MKNHRCEGNSRKTTLLFWSSFGRQPSWTVFIVKTRLFTGFIFSKHDSVDRVNLSRVLALTLRREVDIKLFIAVHFDDDTRFGFPVFANDFFING